ncbi:hypothetical protein QJ48_10335 [Paenibacillus sp. A3]|uniref:hypothetical protein n=1 Tax=Paenibacillus sp. A3 TaxID=1337054 RepID=UPI0006D57585|nr:hypothetical protein [Paenibacillus sp. A3]KPV59557.1 hypothetical protein QJ48_10335 [Paenibacillus sp. A3]
MKTAFKILSSAVLTLSLVTGVAAAAVPTAPTQSANTQAVKQLNLKVGEKIRLHGVKNASSSPYGVVELVIRRSYLNIFYCDVYGVAPGDTIVKTNIGDFSFHVTQ